MPSVSSLTDLCPDGLGLSHAIINNLTVLVCTPNGIKEFTPSYSDNLSVDLGVGLGVGVSLLWILSCVIYSIIEANKKEKANLEYIRSLLTPRAFSDYQSGFLSPLLKTEIKNIKESGKGIICFWHGTKYEFTRDYIMYIHNMDSNTEQTARVPSMVSVAPVAPNIEDGPR